MLCCWLASFSFYHARWVLPYSPMASQVIQQFHTSHTTVKLYPNATHTLWQIIKHKNPLYITFKWWGYRNLVLSCLQLRYKISKTDRHSVHSKSRWNEILLQLDQHRINVSLCVCVYVYVYIYISIYLSIDRSIDISIFFSFFFFKSM